MYLIWTNERYSGDPSIEPTLTAKVDKFLYEKGVYTRIDQKLSQKSRRLVDRKTSYNQNSVK